MPCAISESARRCENTPRTTCQTSAHSDFNGGDTMTTTKKDRLEKIRKFEKDFTNIALTDIQVAQRNDFEDPEMMRKTATWLGLQ
jgi:hypothetical protein